MSSHSEQFLIHSDHLNSDLVIPEQDKAQAVETRPHTSEGLGRKGPSLHTTLSSRGTVQNERALVPKYITYCQQEQPLEGQQGTLHATITQSCSAFGKYTSYVHR